MDSLKTPYRVHGAHIYYTRSPPGVQQDYQDSIRTPDGVHEDAWGSVTYRYKGYSEQLPSIMGQKNANIED